MAKKIYSFNYDFNSAELAFEVDLEKFTELHAKETLEFFSWNYDKDGDPIDEVLKKYALEVLRIGGDLNHSQIIFYWNQEGFGPINGKIGIKLVDYRGIEFDSDNLEMEVSNG